MPNKEPKCAHTGGSYGSSLGVIAVVVKAGFDPGCSPVCAANSLLSTAHSCLWRSLKCISTVQARTNCWAQAQVLSLAALSLWCRAHFPTLVTFRGSQRGLGL